MSRVIPITSQHFRQTASLRLLEAKGTSRLDVEVQAISSTLRSVYAWEADVCYPLGPGSWNPVTLRLKKAIGNRCFQLRYTGVQAQCSHMLFPQPLPATNIRMLAATLQSGRKREGSALSSALTGKHVLKPAVN